MNKKELKTVPINVISPFVHKKHSPPNELTERQSVLSYGSKNQSTKSTINKKEVVDIIYNANEFMNNLKQKS